MNIRTLNETMTKSNPNRGYVSGPSTNTVQSIFTGRNEVLAKVIFLHVSVILLTGGVLQILL